MMLFVLTDVSGVVVFSKVSANKVRGAPPSRVSRHALAKSVLVEAVWRAERALYQAGVIFCCGLVWENERRIDGPSKRRRPVRRP